ncbi:hypothetical protein Tco_1399389, partial [Tanacetum coccineum]
SVLLCLAAGVDMDCQILFCYGSCILMLCWKEGWEEEEIDFCERA